jgi:hypothetical protein
MIYNSQKHLHQTVFSRPLGTVLWIEIRESISLGKKETKKATDFSVASPVGSFPFGPSSDFLRML